LLWPHGATVNQPQPTTFLLQSKDRKCEKLWTLPEWRQQPLGGEFPYVFLDGLWLKQKLWSPQGERKVNAD
jgi:hypothetical protein